MIIPIYHLNVIPAIRLDYTHTTNPNHFAADLNTDCAECHTTNPGWKPAEFIQHDAQFFPVYSGEHGGEWNSCTDCHLNPANYCIIYLY